MTYRLVLNSRHYTHRIPAENIPFTDPPFFCRSAHKNNHHCVPGHQEENWTDNKYFFKNLPFFCPSFRQNTRLCVSVHRKSPTNNKNNLRLSIKAAYFVSCFRKMAIDSPPPGQHHPIMDGSPYSKSDVEVAAGLLLSNSLSSIGNICVLDAKVHSHHSPSLQAAIRKAHLYAGGVILTDLGPESSITGDTFTPRELYIVPMSLMRPTAEDPKKRSMKKCPFRCGKTSSQMLVTSCLWQYQRIIIQ